MILQQQNALKSGTQCIIAFGSNLSNQFGVSAEIVKAAIERMSSAGLVVQQTSRFFRSPAFPADSGPDFVNGVVLCKTQLLPKDVIAALHRIEAELGRTRNARWEARVLDLDLIDYAGVVLPGADIHSEWRELALEDQLKQVPDQLILPHPRVQDRPFVLIPMTDVVPNWVHPVTGHGLRDLLAAFTVADIAEIQPLESGE